MRATARFSTAALVLLVSLLSSAQSGKVESIGPSTDSVVSETVRQSLDTKGYRLSLDDPKPYCEIWLRKSVPSQNRKSDVAAYPQFAPSVMIGVVNFLQDATDYRGHKIPAGLYTLRYELMPDDGNHLGAAPNPDFLVTIPAASDPDPNASFKFQDCRSLWL